MRPDKGLEVLPVSDIKPRTTVRAWHRKGRGGCITCKARHLKCDEGKPVCAKCASTGWTCQGYNAPQKIVRSTRKLAFRRFVAPVMSVERPMSRLNLDNDEMTLGFQYFTTQTIPVLNGLYESPTWVRTLVHLQHSDSALRHCSAAVGSLHAAISLRGWAAGNHGDGSATTLTHSFAVQQYTKALRSLRETIDSAVEIRVLLLACLLLIVYESLQGRRQEMTIHLRHGLSLLNSDTDDKSDDIADIRTAFSSLAFSQVLYGRPRISNSIEVRQLLTESSNLRVPVPLSLMSARLGLHNIKMAILGYVHNLDVGALAHNTTRAKTECEIRNKLQRWSESLEEQMANPLSWIRNVPTSSYNLLHAQYEIANIFLCAYACGSQVVFDRFLPQFERILDLLCAVFVPGAKPGTPQQENGSVFSLDLGVISVLFITAKACRHPLVRRRAMHLLKHVPQREGLWDARVAAAAAQLVVDFEESDTDGLCMSSPFGIPEARRVHIVEIDQMADGDGERINVTLRRRRVGSEPGFHNSYYSVLLSTNARGQRKSP